MPDKKIILLRIIALPGFLLLQIVIIVYRCIANCVLWVKFGGECFAYSPGDKETIYRIYHELKKENEIAFDPTCRLCGDPLTSEELVCYHCDRNNQESLLKKIEVSDV